MKIGIVTGGGDCPGSNAVIRTIAKAATQRDWASLGIFGTYEWKPRWQNHWNKVGLPGCDGIFTKHCNK